MARPCSICTHPRCAEINEDLSPVRDMTPPAVVRKYGDVDIDSVRRHKMNHLIPAFRKDMAIQTRAEEFARRTKSLSDLATKMAEVISYAEEVRDKAYLQGDHKMVLQANAEVRATLMSVAKFVGMEANANAASSNDEVQAARALVLALRVVMPMFPEAFNSLVVELQAQNEFDLASQLESYVNHRKRQS